MLRHEMNKGLLSETRRLQPVTTGGWQFDKKTKDDEEKKT